MTRFTIFLLLFFAYVGVIVLEGAPLSSGMGYVACFIMLIIHFCLFSFVIFTNTKVLIPYLLEKKRFSLYITSLIVLIWLYAFFTNRYNNYGHGVLFHDASVGPGFWGSFVYALCCAVIASMLYITQKWTEQQDQIKNSQINHLQTELKYLRSQLNPHFLFNGLNTVYGYIDMGNCRARDMMVQFSDLLRYNLYEADVDMIELDKEIKYLQNYVAMQKARSNDNMRVTLKVNYKNGGVKIAPLMFMAFVENAFKYASRDDNAINSINIALTEEAQQVDFTCDNTFDEAEATRGGIGLNNAARRLELLYKDRYALDIKKAQNIFHVHLTLAL